MRNAGLDVAQAGIKIARRNINNLTSADDTTLMAESKEELKSLLMKVKKESSRKTSTSALLTMPKPLTTWITKKTWKVFQEMGIPDHHTCLLRNLYAGQEAIVRSGHGTTDCF